MPEKAEEIRRRVAEGDVIIVHRLTDQFEQEVIHQALDQEEIVHDIRLSFEHSYSFLFEPMHGFGAVLVRAVDAERARTLIDAVLALDEEAAAAATKAAEDSVADEPAPVG